MSAAYNFVPVHIITVYLAPYHTKEVEESKNRLKHLVSSILDRVKTSRILVMGDFNHHRVEVPSGRIGVSPFSWRKFVTSTL